MQSMLIVHVPGMTPRIGYLRPGDGLASMREWREANPGANIYVVQAQDLPEPGTACVATLEEAIWEAELAAELDEGPAPNSKG